MDANLLILNPKFRAVTPKEFEEEDLVLIRIDGIQRQTRAEVEMILHCQK